jgi:peptidoglycan/xylan/chitin deacetylase (PgdA/CDA1 family)
MQTIIYKTQPQRDFYALKLLFAFSILLLFLAFTSFYLIQNYYSQSFFDMSEKQELYILQSDTLKTFYEKNGMDYRAYNKRIIYLENIAKENHYEIKKIKSTQLKKLPKHSLLLALDMMSLSEKEIQEINNFVTQGGHILFNFTSGFLTASLTYRKNNLVHSIAGLELNPNINTIKLDLQTPCYLSTKLASPITQFLPKGEALDFNVYDPLPIFKTKRDVEVDGYLTNWSQTNYIYITPSKELNASQSSLIYHGSKGDGKWIYFTFPTYVFLDADKMDYANLFKGMLSYLKNMITIVPYPYVDAKNVVFVSEDTEYKYENLKQFYDVSYKHKFPVTAFCVAQLAKKHQKLMQEVAQSPYLEIGSHSYTHDKIVGESDEVYTRETKGSKELLENITGKKVVGFRAPREEIDTKLLHSLESSGYTYILNEGENRLTSHFKENMLIIPRHATDDYSYLINLDWSAQEILTNMIKELHTVVNLNGMYTLSTHTHLMNFGSNITILDKFFTYVKQHKEMVPMNGSMIYARVYNKEHLTFEKKLTQKKVILTIANNTNHKVMHAHYELYVDPSIILEDVDSEIIGLKTSLKKLSRTKYLLVVDTLKPQSQVTLFLNYIKNKK